MTYKFRNKCCFSLNYCHICVYFLQKCCRVAVWPPFTFPCTKSRSTRFLSAKFLCLGFASTNHITRNHIDRNVYGPHCIHTTDDKGAGNLVPRVSHTMVYPPSLDLTTFAQIIHCHKLVALVSSKSLSTWF